MTWRGWVVLTGLCVTAATAQTHKVAATEKVTRAIGVYEWTGDLAKPSAARLIPVSIFLNGQMQDAGVYLARPVPFVLQTGDVYSIERAGEGLGSLDVDYARNVMTRHAVGDVDVVGSWYGYGRFISAAEEAKAAAKAAAKKKPIVVLGSTSSEPTDDKPAFVRRAPVADAGASQDKNAPEAKPSAGNPAPDQDPDRPTLRHRDPADETKHKSAKGGGYVTPPNTSLNEDTDRPTMRRGVPAGLAATPQMSGMPRDMHQAVAVSDAENHDDHAFEREWESSSDKAGTLAVLETLAKPAVAAYLAQNKLAPPAPSAPPATPPAAPARKPAIPARRATVPHKAVPTMPALAFENEQLRGYTLSYGGMPTFVYTAEVPVTVGGPVYVTLVSQRLPTGEMQVALTSVTDAGHLDRVPWMRPVDVVDADWSHRASLLFELRAQTSRQFALYRLVSAKAEQTFVTGVFE